MEAAINVLQRDPKQEDTKCMICIATNPTNVNHPFNNCPVLKGHEFLKAAYINARGAAKRTLAAQQVVTTKAIRNIESTIQSPSPKDIAINAILCTINENNSSDFQED